MSRKETQQKYERSERGREVRRKINRRCQDRWGNKALVFLARSRAKRDGRECTLPNNWKEDVTRCEWSGLPFVKRHPMYAASIDRIDNNLGYTPENCRLILRGLNVFKNKHDQATIDTVLAALCHKHGEAL